MKRQDPGSAELTVAGLDAKTRVSADTGSYPIVKNERLGQSQTRDVCMLRRQFSGVSRGRR